MSVVSVGEARKLRIVVQDCLFLGLAIALSFILYVRRIGFYSDQWAFLAAFSLSPDRSISGLFWAVYTPNSWPRPVEMLYLVGLYALFGSEPLGYQLVNAAMLVSLVVLFYLVLVELGQPRPLALAVPVVYGLLPHYSTDRFWSLTSNLSMALYFLSLYADLAALRARWPRVLLWKSISVLSMLGSALSYEVALPLFLLNPFLVWYRSRRDQHTFAVDERSQRAKVAAVILSGLVVLAAVVSVKASTTTRLGEQPFMERSIAIARRAVALNYGEYDYGLNIKQALAINYRDYGTNLPRLVVQILRTYPDGVIITTGGFLGLVVFAYLAHVAGMTTDAWADRTNLLKLTAVGLLVFGLGYAIFLTNTNVQFSMTGLANRTSIAAAAGVALSFVAGIGFVSALLPTRQLRRHLFCLLAALLCTGGFLVVNTIAVFWAEAYRLEQAVLADIRDRFPAFDPGTTLLLDGVCPYVGPAIVFESNWDLKGALQLLYQDRSLRADIVTPRLRIEDDGIVTRIYSFEERYPYDNLLIYHYGRKETYRIKDGEGARRYFRHLNPDGAGGCPEGHEGHGVRIF